MAKLRGSWPVLLGLAAAFLLLFWWQRSRSQFLAIERQRPTAVRLAADCELPLADVLALRDMVGLDVAVERWRAAGQALASLLGPAEPSAASRRAAIEQVAPNAVAARRFLMLRERFAARH